MIRGANINGVKKLVPNRIKPHLRRIRASMQARMQASDWIGKQLLDPCVTDVSMADEYVVTFLIRSREFLRVVVAQIVSASGQTDVPLVDVARYRQNSRHYLLAKLHVDAPLEPGTTINVSAGGKLVALHAARIRSTQDKSYPLIDKLFIEKSSSGLTVSEGAARRIQSPVLESVTVSEDAETITFTVNTPLKKWELAERNSDRRLMRDARGGSQIQITQEEVFAVVDGVVPTDQRNQSEIHEEYYLVDLIVDSEAGVGRRIVHRDPWVGQPRNLQTFRAIAMRRDAVRVIVRPYWTVGGNLSLKLTRGTV